MNPSTRLILTTAAIFAACAVSAEPTDGSTRSDTDFPSNFAGPDHDPVTRAPGTSNWPGLPERQGGRSYSKLVVTTSGVRQRNAESGRR